MPMVVMSASLPEQLIAREDRAIGAGEFVAPAGGIDVSWHFGADAAALACAHAAGHRALDGDLDRDVALVSDFGDALHHGLGAAGVDEELRIADCGLRNG